LDIVSALYHLLSDGEPRNKKNERAQRTQCMENWFLYNSVDTEAPPPCIGGHACSTLQGRAPPEPRPEPRKEPFSLQFCTTADDHRSHSLHRRQSLLDTSRTGATARRPSAHDRNAIGKHRFCDGPGARQHHARVFARPALRRTHPRKKMRRKPPCCALTPARPHASNPSAS